MHVVAGPIVHRADTSYPPGINKRTGVPYEGRNQFELLVGDDGEQLTKVSCTAEVLVKSGLEASHLSAGTRVIIAVGAWNGGKEGPQFFAREVRLGSLTLLEDSPNGAARSAKAPA